MCASKWMSGGSSVCIQQTELSCPYHTFDALRPSLKSSTCVGSSRGCWKSDAKSPAHGGDESKCAHIEARTRPPMRGDGNRGVGSAQKSAKSGAPSPLAANAAVSGEWSLPLCMYTRDTAATILRWKPSGSGLPFESQRLRSARGRFRGSGARRDGQGCEGGRSGEGSGEG